ncbi:oxidative stress survival, Svf1-like protein [Polychaeton citri CBS 116435]|uniref:Ceramide-binding protein SVF1 n=1 Tax=Polychaeton citri CBS 116435 TaxID=1314669 RepID=A0A9P4UPX8_9PEZI|nr:oxidative stress survival, Svf1-like protein [Polychaeton citri CBS 116435]
MWNWAKQTVGITEPVYGPSAIQPVSQQSTGYTETTKNDLKWECMDSTNVETKTFYFTSDSGHLGLVQVIYSNVMGIRTTAQFSTKIFSQEPGKPHLWASDNLTNFTFSGDGLNFKGDGCSMDISEDGKSYHIKSNINKQSIVDVTFTQDAPGFVAGKNGTSYYGTDPKNPWGRMRHIFWPRCIVEGNIITQQGPVDLKGRGFFVHALQGMKPHFAAGRWNFINFQSPTYSAVMMQFTTPESYGHTVVNVGGIAKKGELLGAGTSGTLVHEGTKPDSDNEWPEPTGLKVNWSAESKDGNKVEAELSGSLGPRVDRVDVMGELPKFVKQIATSASGTKPYIYQYSPKLTLKINDNGEQKEEEGQLFMEATFIS